jgi:glycine/D-amino acid oxidase-like deaminating enzyme
MRHDALIIGTRCSGATLAMLLVRRGFKILAVDRVRFPSDTLSTHFMWPRTTSFLAAWGERPLSRSPSRRVDRRA